MHVIHTYVLVEKRERCAGEVGPLAVLQATTGSGQLAIRTGEAG